MKGKNAQRIFAIFAGYLILLMLVCPYLPTPTGVVHDRAGKIFPALLTVPAVVAVLLAASGGSALTHVVAAPSRQASLLDLTCTRLC
ncbi:MAG TPA: hypothetical protein VLE48_07680 [Terriglobales bacterium]|nr:hypothetical protein [Terriglobales bacterium]